MDRLVRTDGRIIALVAIALLAAACGSSSSPAPAASAAASSGVAASVAPPATGSAATAPASAAPSVAVPSSAASTSADGSAPQPAGTPCDWLDKATIDASLGLSVGKPIPSGGVICTWISTAPRGGFEVSIILSVAQIDAMVANYKQIPGGQLVSGLGVKAMATGRTGLAAPLPKSHFNVVVDYGGWGMSVDASGPDVTVAEVSALAAAIVHP